MMSASEETRNRTLKAKKAGAAQSSPFTNPSHSGPTTFFLRSEKEVERSTQRGRKASRDLESSQDESMQKIPMASSDVGASSFGVESLEDAISTTGSSLSRTDSNLSEMSTDAGAANDGGVVAGRKGKARNPVHPKIVAAGQRIISNEYSASQAASAASPISQRSAESPFRTGLRRNSASSSVNLSQPLTPLKMSPQPESAMPSTPRSGSPKSFRLSDEEASIASDTGSQAVQSSSGEEDEDAQPSSTHRAESMPQLVMPSIAMPSRRPFTERGRRMGRLRVMVVGARGVGKTSLIQSICRVCEDVVHMDSLTGTSTGSVVPPGRVPVDGAPQGFTEIGASTRPYPSWWTDFESRRQLYKRKSIGEGVLERNITFVDTPALDSGINVRRVMQHFKNSLSRIANAQSMHDSELIHLLSGEGGVGVDVVLYLVEPTKTAKGQDEPSELEQQGDELLRFLCKSSNVIPLIARADTVDEETLAARKSELTSMLADRKVEIYTSQKLSATSEEIEQPSTPYAVSSALGDDVDEIDASTLMSSSYLQPLVPSELAFFVEQLLEPDNIARLRHLAATKYLLWRQENLSSHLNFNIQKQPNMAHPPTIEIGGPDITHTGSIVEDPSKVLVPHGSSSYFRSTSPSASESSAGNNALTRFNGDRNASPSAPFRQIRLAKWAQDLQRSLDNERKRYTQMFSKQPSDNGSSDSEKQINDPNSSLTTTTSTTTRSQRPLKGRLGGEIGVIDPRDPLGVLAFGQVFRRRGWFALQLATGCGVVGAAAWWVVRNWADVQDYFGLAGPPATVIHVNAVPASSLSSGRGRFDDWDWREMLGMGR